MRPMPECIPPFLSLLCKIKEKGGTNLLNTEHLFGAEKSLVALVLTNKVEEN